MDSDIPFVSDSDTDAEINVVAQTPPNPFLLTRSSSTPSPPPEPPPPPPPSQIPPPRLPSTSRRNRGSRISKPSKRKSRNPPSTSRGLSGNRRSCFNRKRQNNSVIDKETGHEYEVVSSDVMMRTDTVMSNEFNSASNYQPQNNHIEPDRTVYTNPNEVFQILESDSLVQGHLYYNPTLPNHQTTQEIMQIDPIQALQDDNIEHFHHSYQPSRNLYQTSPSRSSYSPLEQSIQVMTSQDSPNYNLNNFDASDVNPREDVAFTTDLSQQSVFCTTGQDHDFIVGFNTTSQDDLNNGNAYGGSFDNAPLTLEDSTTVVGQFVPNNFPGRLHLNFASSIGTGQSSTCCQLEENNYEPVYATAMNFNETMQYFQSNENNSIG